MEPTMTMGSDFVVRSLWARHSKLFDATIFLVNCFAAVSVGLVWIAEVFVIGESMFPFVFLFLPIFGICLIASAFFSWSKNPGVVLVTVVVSVLVLLVTVGVLNEERNAPPAQRLYPLQVTYFLLIPLLIQLLSAILTTYKLIQLRLSR
jgi:hypothetical protein